MCKRYSDRFSHVWWCELCRLHQTRAPHPSCCLVLGSGSWSPPGPPIPTGVADRPASQPRTQKMDTPIPSCLNARVHFRPCQSCPVSASTTEPPRNRYAPARPFCKKPPVVPEPGSRFSLLNPPTTDRPLFTSSAATHPAITRNHRCRPVHRHRARRCSGGCPAHWL